MDYSLITFFLVVVLFGSYFQSVTGFAMGMIIVSLLGGLRIVDIPVLTAVISLLTIVNVILALKGRLHEVDRRNLEQRLQKVLPLGILSLTIE